MRRLACSMTGVLLATGLLAPLPVRAQDSFSPAVLECQRNRADPTPCWSEFLAGPAPARHKALLVALTFSTSYRPAPSAQAAAFLQSLLQAAEQPRSGVTACKSPDCETEDDFYARAVRAAWASINSAAASGKGASPANANQLGGEPK